MELMSRHISDLFFAPEVRHNHTPTYCSSRDALPFLITETFFHFLRPLDFVLLMNPYMKISCHSSKLGVLSNILANHINAELKFTKALRHI